MRFPSRSYKKISMISETVSGEEPTIFTCTIPWFWTSGGTLTRIWPTSIVEMLSFWPFELDGELDDEISISTCVIEVRVREALLGRVFDISGLGANTTMLGTGFEWVLELVAVCDIECELVAVADWDSIDVNLWELLADWLISELVETEFSCLWFRRSETWWSAEVWCAWSGFARGYRRGFA